MTAQTAATDSRPLGSPLQRGLALVSFAGRTVGSGWAFRLTRVYAWAAAVSYVALAAAWSARGEVISGSAIVFRGVVWISWAGGSAAWIAARDVRADETRLGLRWLAALRGASPQAFLAARTVATISLVGRVVGWPAIGLAVAVAFLARHVDGVWVGVSNVAAAAAYSVLFGVVFGGLARLSSHVNPRHGRAVFVAFVLGPEVLQSVFADVPSLVSGFGSVLGLLVGVGGSA